MEGEVTLAPSPSSHAQDTHTSAAMEDRAGLTKNILDVIMILTIKSIVFVGEYHNILDVIIIVTRIAIFQLQTS